MSAAATELLHSLLIVLNRVPGRQALLLVPLALGYSKLNPEFCSSKADAQAPPASSQATTALNGGGAQATAAVPDVGLPGPFGVLATQLMGQNQFASVSVGLPGAWLYRCYGLQTLKWLRFCCPAADQQCGYVL
jgi:hypothetical protein